ncbi:hypothetical protein CRUP_020116 [Coryphaenoides rupestris]|nr:hypothetical protein CRUP_020116 [Coryphaenoides rupestris]
MAETKLYSRSQEAGKAAAKYFVDNNPKYFTKDFAEPHIPCLMPASVSMSLEEVSEEALKERIGLRKVAAAVEMYDQLVQAGTPVSKQITYDLLDLVSFYDDREPAQEGAPVTDQMDTPAKEPSRRRGRGQKVGWQENNNADRLFRLLPERDGRCYAALIRGMVKHGASSKAFDLYTDMLNNRLTADIHVYNALILATPHVRETHSERIDLIKELLTTMNQQKMQPTLQTFNNVLMALRSCGGLAKSQALYTLREMKALGIAPTPASYNHLLAIFYRGVTGSNDIDILDQVLSEIARTSFTCQDPEDAWFFSGTMNICLETKGLKQAYQLYKLTEVGENWRLLGDPFQENMFYYRFLSLVCMMENMDVVLKWYRQLVPSVYYPNPQLMRYLLQAVDMDSRLELVPSIWKDMKSLGHDDKSWLVVEVQESFAACALDIKGAFAGEGRKINLEWSTAALYYVTTILMRANKTPEACDELLKDFLSQRSATPAMAVELVQMSAGFFLATLSELQSSWEHNE